VVTMVALTSHSDTVWRVAPYSWSDADRLARELGLPFVAATILASRGLGDPVKARAFLECVNEVPDPYLFGHMAAAVDAILGAVTNGDRIVVHGDYDADGITATALMVLGLRELGLAAESYLPNRFTEGYGLSRGAVESIAASGPGLLITVDCGVNYPDEVARARELGLEVVVVDHHEPGPVLPDCHLIHSVVGHYPNSDLCGVGLAFKVVHALHMRLYGSPATEVPEQLHKYLDLVAVGTIADLAPVLGENRYYVKEGLKLIAIGARTGFRALAKVASCTGGVDSGAVAFRIAPRLNAAGRLADATPPLDLLLTDDERKATEISQKLHELNGERQDVERRILEDAVAQAESLSELPPILVLSGKEWHEGVVGIVASRLVEKYSRPAILLSVRDGIAKGSGRSISAYDLVCGLNECADWLTVYGGHTMAVGLTLAEDNLEGFKKAIEEHAASVLKASDLLPLYRADAVLRGEDISSDTAVALASLGPFGSGNPRPRLVVLDAEVSQPEVTRTGGHLRCLVDVEGVRARAIGFGLGDKLSSLRDNPRRRALGVQLRNNEWQGNLKPEFQLDSVGEPTAATELTECGPECSHRAVSPAGAQSVEAGVPQSEGLLAGHSARHPGGGDAPFRVTSARDLRDDAGRTAALAQVLATGEPAVLLVCSVPHTLADLTARIPFADLVGGEVGCAGKSCWQSGTGCSDAPRVVVVEWDAAIREPAFTKSRVHAVVLDPPYRPQHTSLVRSLADEGVRVHLLYGDVERNKTAKLLRYLVHPRFAMVCVYRALRRGASEHEVHQAAAELAWGEGHVVLSAEDLSRASQVLAQLGLEQPMEGAAKIEASIVPLYADAEADYEECSRLCRIL
jgi:single-stranded-DNA-specific exonuclease